MLSYKQSRRREDDLAIVNAGLRVLMIPAMEEGVNESDGGWRIGECNLVYGGMNYKTVMAIETQQKLIGRFVARFKIAMFAKLYPCVYMYGTTFSHTYTILFREWNEATLQEATRLLSEELQLSSDAPGGMPEYRMSLVTSFFFKFYLTVSHLLIPQSLPQDLHSVTHTFHRSITCVYSNH